MKKTIKENYSFSPSDPIQLVNNSYNISKVSDPIELKRMNNYIQSVIASGPFQSAKDTMTQLRSKLNLLGFDIDVPRNLGENQSFNSPLKRFGGIIGIDDNAQKLDNPYGPGPKMDIQVSVQEGFVTARIVPSVPVAVESESPAAASLHPETKEEVKEEQNFSNILRSIRRK